MVNRRLISGVVWLVLVVAQRSAPASDAIEQHIRARIAAAPHDADNWRLLARVLLRRGDLQAGHDALQTAVNLDPTSPAVHYDLGCVLLDLRRGEQAVDHLRHAVDLAPDSEHAADAMRQLEELTNDPQNARLASFSPSWMNAPRVEDAISDPVTHARSPQRLFLSVELGALYNSNVQLAPISRRLPPSELGGFQAYVAPDLELLMFDSDAWQIGTLLDTYFNVNEANLSEFNLQHYQPAAYVDRRVAWGDSEWVTRLQYDYSLDFFDDDVYGNKHALTTSLTVFHERPVATAIYWTIDYTDFRDDGNVPDVDSLDGMTNSVGISRSRELSGPFFCQFDIGCDVQWADLRGSDHAYRGVFVYAESASPFLLGSELIVTGGWGYRDFPDFIAAPSRNETLYVGGLQLERTFVERWRLTTFFNYESFDTPNDAFSAERKTAGMYVTYCR